MTPPKFNDSWPFASAVSTNHRLKTVFLIHGWETAVENAKNVFDLWLVDLGLWNLWYERADCIYWKKSRHKYLCSSNHVIQGSALLTLSLPTHEHSIPLHLLRLFSLISLSNVLYFLVYRSWTYYVAVTCDIQSGASLCWLQIP